VIISKMLISVHVTMTGSKTKLVAPKNDFEMSATTSEGSSNRGLAENRRMPE
jgi:hypothetical protein